MIGAFLAKRSVAAGSLHLTAVILTRACRAGRGMPS